jgi:NTP pyrophosphatase (non-canonical NTP hydrolase)
VDELTQELLRDRLELTRSNGKPVGAPAELADIVITCASLACHFDIDLNRALRAKMRHNYRRAFPKNTAAAFDPNQQPLFNDQDW